MDPVDHHRAWQLSDLPSQHRPRERLRLLGEGRLSDVELLSVLVGSPVLDLAQDLLARFGGLDGLARAGLSELCAVRGIGSVRAGRLKAALELGRRATLISRAPLARFGRSDDVARYFGPRLAGLTQERLYLVLLDCRNRVFRIEMVAQGGLTGISVHPREILGPAIREAAAGLILVHNHPSGDPTPSEVDRELTQRVAAASELMGIPLLDHVIVARDGSTSLMTV